MPSRTKCSIAMNWERLVHGLWSSLIIVDFLYVSTIRMWRTKSVDENGPIMCRRLHGAARFAAFVYSSKNGLPLKPSQIHHKMAESEPKLKVFSWKDKLGPKNWLPFKFHQNSAQSWWHNTGWKCGIGTTNNHEIENSACHCACTPCGCSKGHFGKRGSGLGDVLRVTDPMDQLKTDGKVIWTTGGSMGRMNGKVFQKSGNSSMLYIISVIDPCTLR
jgi:hypothetical protein